MTNTDTQTGSAGPDGVSRSELCRELNDAFRRNFSGGKVVVTQGVASLPVAEQAEILDAVRAFDSFTVENDPYGEHDFAAVVVGGTRYLFKIEYYDLDLRYGSSVPSDPAATIRVMTIMRADEY